MPDGPGALRVPNWRCPACCGVRRPSTGDSRVARTPGRVRSTPAGHHRPTSRTKPGRDRAPGAWRRWSSCERLPDLRVAAVFERVVDVSGLGEGAVELRQIAERNAGI